MGDCSLKDALATVHLTYDSFLGYSRLGNEITAHKADWREQLDLSTPHPLPTEKDPLYHNLLAPNQWPNESALPKFRPVFEDCKQQAVQCSFPRSLVSANRSDLDMKKMSDVSTFFTSLIAESLSLPPTAFDNFFDGKDQQHKLKIVKYPDNGSGAGQGVGPHKDSMLTSYLLQASEHRGLQAQNTQGEWIDCKLYPHLLTRTHLIFCQVLQYAEHWLLLSGRAWRL